MKNPLKVWQEKREAAAAEKAREKAAIAAEKARLKAEAEEASRVAARKAAMAAELVRIQRLEFREMIVRRIFILGSLVVLSPLVLLLAVFIGSKMDGFSAAPSRPTGDGSVTPAVAAATHRAKAAADLPAPPSIPSPHRTWVDAHLREGKPVKGHWRKLK